MPEGFEVRRRIAQFRGIPLEILGSSRGGGRRLDVHEFGKREKPWAEDMGRAARSFSVRGIVIGSDHDLDGEKLEKAFEKNGPGELILPHRAPISVAVRSYQFEEPERETRLQRFNVEFVEAGVPAIPGARKNTSGNVKTRGEKAVAETRSRFAEVFSISNETEGSIIRIGDVATASTVTVSTEFDALKSTTEILEDVAATADSVSELSSRMSQTLINPFVSAGQFQNAIDQILDLPFAPIKVFRELSSVSTFGTDLVDPGTSSFARRRFKTNQDAIVALARETGTIARARALADVKLESSTDAAALRDEIAAELDVLIVTASDALADNVVAALRALRTATIRDLDTRGARLPARVIYEPQSITPAIVVAQRLYGDPERDAEIVSRNRAAVPNPGRIYFGTDLEVLASA